MQPNRQFIDKLRLIFGSVMLSYDDRVATCSNLPYSYPIWAYDTTRCQQIIHLEQDITADTSEERWPNHNIIELMFMDEYVVYDIETGLTHRLQGRTDDRLITCWGSSDGTYIIRDNRDGSAGVISYTGAAIIPTGKYTRIQNGIAGAFIADGGDAEYCTFDYFSREGKLTRIAKGLDSIHKELIIETPVYIEKGRNGNITVVNSHMKALNTIPNSAHLIDRHANLMLVRNDDGVSYINPITGKLQKSEQFFNKSIDITYKRIYSKLVVRGAHKYILVGDNLSTIYLGTRPLPELIKAMELEMNVELL